MKRFSMMRISAFFVVAWACAALASCDKMQEAVDQAKMEAAKFQAQAEAEAQKLKEQALQASATPESAATPSETPAGGGATTAPAPGGFGLPGAPEPTAAPVPATTPSVSGVEQVQKFVQKEQHLKVDADLVALAALDEGSRDALVELDLSGTPVTSAGLAVLPRFAQLQRLNLTLKPLSAADLAALARLPALEVLKLNGTGVDDQAVAELRPLVQLRVLELGGTRISDAGLVTLRDLDQLEELSVSATGCTGEGLARLRCVPGLKRLEIADLNFNLGGEKVLRQAKALEVLNAFNAQMNDVLTAQLKGQQHLHTLHLNKNPGVSDRGAMQLGGLPALEVLNLNDNPRIGDATLGALRKCKNLKDLKVIHTDCHPPGVQALQKALPDLKIEYP